MHERVIYIFLSTQHWESGSASPGCSVLRPAHARTDAQKQAGGRDPAGPRPIVTSSPNHAQKQAGDRIQLGRGPSRRPRQTTRRSKQEPRGFVPPRLHNDQEHNLKAEANNSCRTPILQYLLNHLSPGPNGLARPVWAPLCG